MELLLENKALAMSHDKQYYTWVSEKEVDMVRKEGDSVLERNILEKVNLDNCILGIFFDKTTAVKNHCKYDVLMGALKPNLQSIGRYKLLLSNTESYTEKCGNTTSTKAGCQQCIINREPDCVVHTPDQAGVAQYSDNLTVRHHDKLFLVNKAL